MEGGGGDVAGGLDGGGYDGFGGGFDAASTGLDPSAMSTGDFASDIGYGSFSMDPSVGMDEENMSWGDLPVDDGSSAIGDLLSKGLKGLFGTTLGKGLQMAATMSNPALGPLFGIGNLGYGASQGKGGSAFGGMFGGQLGSMAGGPLGALAGSTIGSQLGSTVNGQAPGGFSGGTPDGGSGMDALGAGLGLGGLLYGYGQGQRGINGQLGDLNSMYGQNSSYAQALRQQLERRDAAGGRRSQYGPREVELQAALAGANSRNAPLVAQLNQQKALQQQKLLQTLGYGYQQVGGLQGLRDLFNPGPTGALQNVYSQPFDVGSTGLSGTTGPGLTFPNPNQEFDLSGLFGG